MILTDKDAITLQNTEFKAVELSSKYLNISVKNDIEGEKLEREILKYRQQLEREKSKQNFSSPDHDYSIDEDAQKKERIQMTLWETRKLNEHHQSLIKE